MKRCAGLKRAEELGQDREVVSTFWSAVSEISSDNRLAVWQFQDAPEY